MPEHEPDLRIISREFPVPNNPMTREIQIVLETIKQGPRARMVSLFHRLFLTAFYS